MVDEHCNEFHAAPEHTQKSLLESETGDKENPGPPFLKGTSCVHGASEAKR